MLGDFLILMLGCVFLLEVLLLTEKGRVIECPFNLLVWTLGTSLQQRIWTCHISCFVEGGNHHLT